MTCALALGICNHLSYSDNVHATSRSIDKQDGKYEIDSGFSNGYCFWVDPVDKNGSKKRLRTIYSVGTGPQLYVDNVAYSCGHNNVPDINFCEDTGMPYKLPNDNVRWETEWDRDNNTAYTTYDYGDMLVYETIKMDTEHDNFIIKYDVTNQDNKNHVQGLCIPLMYNADDYVLKNDPEEYEIEYVSSNFEKFELPKISLLCTAQNNYNNPELCTDLEEIYTVDFDLSQNQNNPVDRIKIYYPDTQDNIRVNSPYEAEMRSEAPAPDQMKYRYISLIWDEESIAPGETKTYRTVININENPFELKPITAENIEANASGKFWAKIHENEDTIIPVNFQVTNPYLDRSIYGVSAAIEELPYKLYFADGHFDGSRSASLSYYELKPLETKTFRFKIGVPKDYYINRGSRTKVKFAFTFNAIGIERQKITKDIIISETPFTVVSLGDSFSAGDTIQPYYSTNFYFDDLNLELKDPTDTDKPFYDNEDVNKRFYDLLAHRSMLSWPGLLKNPYMINTLSNFNVKYEQPLNQFPNDCKWYFEAVSSAVSQNINDVKQRKPDTMSYVISTLEKKLPGFEHLLDPYGYNNFDSLPVGSIQMPFQTEVFDKIEDPIDYVTLTIGGNDMGFADIMMYCLFEWENEFVIPDLVELAKDASIEDIENNSFYGGQTCKSYLLDKRMERAWEKYDAEVRDNLKKTYKTIEDKSNKATIIVAGYPELVILDGAGAGFGGWKMFDASEAMTVNYNVRMFDIELKKLVSECKNEGMNIEFVDVVPKFKNNGAGSYEEYITGSYEEYINGMFHPNKAGAEAYAECVNKKIAELEEKRY